MNTTTIIENIKRYYKINEEEARTMYNEHCEVSDNAPSLYVSTYEKYNRGSLQGAWVDLSSFNNYAELREFFNAIHSDENSAEFMYQDYINMPSIFYDEAYFCENRYKKILEYAKACEEYDSCFVTEMLESYECTSIEDISDKIVYNGDIYDYIDNMLQDLYGFDNLPEIIRYNIDYQGIARSLEFEGYHEVGEYVIHC